MSGIGALKEVEVAIAVVEIKMEKTENAVQESTLKKVNVEVSVEMWVVKEDEVWKQLKCKSKQWQQLEI